MEPDRRTVPWLSFDEALDRLLDIYPGGPGSDGGDHAGRTLLSTDGVMQFIWIFDVVNALLEENNNWSNETRKRALDSIGIFFIQLKASTDDGAYIKYSDASLKELVDALRPLKTSS